MSEAPRPRVLVVDDRQNMVRLLTKVLREDADVVGAAGGAEAIATLKSAPFDAVVCDLKMPEVSGMDARRRSCTPTPSSSS